MCTPICPPPEKRKTPPESGYPIWRCFFFCFWITGWLPITKIPHPGDAGNDIWSWKLILVAGVGHDPTTSESLFFNLSLISKAAFRVTRYVTRTTWSHISSKMDKFAFSPLMRTPKDSDSASEKQQVLILGIAVEYKKIGDSFLGNRQTNSVHGRTDYVGSCVLTIQRTPEGCWAWRILYIAPNLQLQANCPAHFSTPCLSCYCRGTRYESPKF